MKRLLLCVVLLSLSRLTAAAESQLPRPPELEPDVQFWIRVYSAISTNEGFIHDQHALSVVYETLHFEADTPQRERERKVDAERERFQSILRRLGQGAPPQDAEEQRVHDLWGSDATPSRLAEAADDVRFQLGQSDRFRAGLLRAGAWETHIAEVLANLGLPPEIAALPHVESSFDPAAYSKVGAAGLWQFMRSTGRRFLRIDAAVDERLDPFRETEAAAQLLSYNYRLLGTWPLAITAYNHGAEGMRRARDQLGTDDIVRIVRDYHSPSFGFASRNFYVSFLAALSIAQDPDKYFGALDRSTESQFQEIKMATGASAATLTRALGVDHETLRELNPALRPAVWNGRRSVPPGYVLRLPASASKWTADLLAQRLAGARVIAVADAGPAATPRLLAAAPEPDTATPAARADSAKAAVQESLDEEQAVAAASKATANSEPVSAAQAQAQGPQLVPGTMGSESPDPVDYSVAADGSIRVVAAETLGHYADWLGTSAARLRALNNLHARTPVVMGRRVKLVFQGVTAQEFEQRRRDYHERLQAAYFASHRIAGTQVYIARRGDSLWSITEAHVKVPIWLLQQYNPDLDFSDLRPGTQISLPQVEDVSSL